jgi:hypothetical protein
MAIRKSANNMTITVKSSYNLEVGGILEKITNKMNIETLKRNITLISNKKIVADGNQ